MVNAGWFGDASVMAEDPVVDKPGVCLMGGSYPAFGLLPIVGRALAPPRPDGWYSSAIYNIG